MIAVSMRMMRHAYPSSEYEIRDTLAHGWWHFLRTALPNVPLFSVPNISDAVPDLLRQLPITGIILTGGEDWGVFPERDATEEILIRYAQHMELPIMGVCRGAQVLNRIMGGNISLGFAQKHVCTRHPIQIISSASGLPWPQESLNVNSYHSSGIKRKHLALDLTPWAIAGDGSVEGFSGDNGRLMGIMWHPERETVAQKHDIRLFQQHMNRIKG